MFRFPLEPLLRYRRQKEDTEKYELANRVRSMQAIQNNLEMIEKKAANITVAAKKQMTSPGVTMPIIAWYSNYLDQLRRLRAATRDKLAQAETETESQRKKLIKASVDRKIIERFKEIKRQAYYDDEAKKEQKTIDEINTLRAGRKDEKN